MRNRWTTTAALAAAALALLSGCAVAPAPAPGKPAPRLPADSVAYDELPVITTRPKLFPGDCSQFDRDPQLTQRLQGRSPRFNSFVKACVLLRSAGTQVEIGSTDPDRRLPQPWIGYWKAYSYGLYHFRRILVLDRYYAVSQLDQNGCLVAVNIGAAQVVTVRVGAQPPVTGGYENMPRPGDSVEQDRRMANAFCPDAVRAAETYLNEVDPGGGSLAS
ncbi:hypothetical protein [Amycolatopsis sulphurea]|uniref:hypothetical protein n=1 Tax=Amycolatopsis sulphurea TaxID=76022 RepID=UPI001FECC13A|nr:hypothetical protein [Amycolatopsis sulphurea]